MMQGRWVIMLFAVLIFLFAFAATAVANSLGHSSPAQSSLLRRCEDNYDDEELAAIYANGDDYYEPDDCQHLSNTLTGPELHNFCQPGDEDWLSFRARPNLIYQIRAAPQWNYPTEPHLELLDEGVVTRQNDHYFGNDAEIWWWNDGGDRRVFVRVTELSGRAECGNGEYTISLGVFTERP